MGNQLYRKRSVTRDGNNIYIHKLNRSLCVSDFIRMMYDGLSRGYEDFHIYWNGTGTSVYPNACVPVAGIIEYYRQKGIKFHTNIATSEYLSSCHFISPVYLTDSEISTLHNPFDQVFRYDTPSQVAAFTQKCVDCISRQTICEEGILKSLIWCINEVMDNVLLHSQSTAGYVMAQFHSQNNHIAICVSDTGIGIYNSLKLSTHHPSKAIDALTLAIQEGVGDGQGQGNGLFGLYQIVRANGGRLTLTSGPASLMLTENLDLQKYDNIPYVDRNHQGTTVDFQLDLNKVVDIKTAFSSIGGFDGFDIRIDNMLQEDDSLMYNVFENCEGTATREAGRLLMNDVINTVRRANSRICLDFSQIATVSSSFIDEFIAKMIIEMGIVNFNQIVSISGMNDTVKHLCERSIYMRIFEEWRSTHSTSL
ncbi:DUF4325 domain-containing protein [Pseudoflavonifractor capillosus]|uniref:STAS-like domain-containing protein n=1 Tax=Pseudoflavonifractor capillosus TaxID=106588 RepID=UPI00195EE92D|nr:DUF4325 domain-containing protein [Pseudoflavonifractor capillosus]MBM6897537.1 DUF4325 domain-containing protein [Pseudoflavonifractor capillosus]